MNISKRAEEWKNGLTRFSEHIPLVAEENGKVIGFAAGLENRKLNLLPNSDCELWAIYVHPDYFRKGAGAKLLSAFKSEMIKLGKKSLSIWVLRDNAPARKFYEKNGGTHQGITETVKIGTQKLHLRWPPLHIQNKS